MIYHNILVFDCKALSIPPHCIYIPRTTDFLQYNFMASTSAKFIIGEFEFCEKESYSTSWNADLKIYNEAASVILKTGRDECKLLKDIIEMLTPAVSSRLQLGNSHEFEIVTVSLCWGLNADPNIKSIKQQLAQR